MNRTTRPRLWMMGIVAAVLATGCGSEQCDQLGEHLADLALQEAKAAGQEVADDKRAEIVSKTIEGCNAEPPNKEALECALKASSTKAMKKCEGVDEDAQPQEEG